MTEKFLSWLTYWLDFSNIFNISSAASWLVLAVLLLRLPLRKAPRWMRAALWGLVAVRLLFPYAFESGLSLIPSTEVVPHDILRYEGVKLHEPARLDLITNPAIGKVSTHIGRSVGSFQLGMLEMTFVWLGGLALLLVYVAAGHLYLYRRTKTAVCMRDNIFQCETVETPFVFGVLKPKIYLPFAVDGGSLEYVIAHEQAHIRRWDHRWKLLGFLLASAHWFNPLMWLAYTVLCRDIEMACDEKVIERLSDMQRADYAQALLQCSTGNRVVAAHPLSFGEVGVKARVKAVLEYRKPSFGAIAAAAAAAIILAVCFVANPKEPDGILVVNGISYYQQSAAEEELPRGSREIGRLGGVKNKESDTVSADFYATDLAYRYVGMPIFQSGSNENVLYLVAGGDGFIPFARGESVAAIEVK